MDIFTFSSFTLKYNNGRHECDFYLREYISLNSKLFLKMVDLNIVTAHKILIPNSGANSLTFDC